jgi:hypothetical protein
LMSVVAILRRDTQQMTDRDRAAVADRGAVSRDYGRFWRAT